MDASEAFGLAVMTMLACAWLSGDHVRQKLALLLLLAWASTNLAVNYLGFARAPLITPTRRPFNLSMLSMGEPGGTTTRATR